MPTRKVMEAHWIWRQFPRQIASDLSEFHNRRIADWHRGTRDADGYLKLSSYELLELLEFMNEKGALKTAARGGALTYEQRVQAETFNEIARLRASYHAVNGGKDAAYEPFEFVDPLVQKMRDDEERELEQLRAEAEVDLFAKFDW